MDAMLNDAVVAFVLMAAYRLASPWIYGHLAALVMQWVNSLLSVTNW